MQDSPSEKNAREPRDPPPDPARERLVHVYEQRPDGDDSSCLRPLGLCELGGACDICWYSPTHPRHQRSDAD